MSYQTELVVGDITEAILASVTQTIELNAILQHNQKFACTSFMSLAFELNSQAVGPPSAQPKPIIEEGILDVSKLQKDSLMPNQCQKDEPRQAVSPMSLASSRRKSPRFTKRSSSKLSNKLRSISFNDCRDKQTACVPICSLANQEDTPEIDGFRQQTQYRLRKHEQDVKWHTDRKNHAKQKLDSYMNLTKGKLNMTLTYDYEGDACAVDDQEKKRATPQMLRTGMGFGQKRIRQEFGRGDPETMNVSSHRKAGKGKEDSQIQSKALDIPLFPMKPVEGFDKKNLKLEEFKKYYGKRYERLDKTQTIDVKPGKRVDTFAEPRHLKDHNGQEATFQIKARVTQRKLALPRLHGRYKCLDRYQEH